MPGRLQAVQPGLQPGAQGCRAEQVPAVAQGLCAGAGTLPPARLSTQLPGELPRALRGDVWGEGAPRHGRAGQGRAGQGRAGAFCCHSCCLGLWVHSCIALQGTATDLSVMITKP